jgi:predicted CoA-binding protein
MTNYLDKKHSFAIIGASNNEEKYGYKIYKQMKKIGIKIFPINNKEDFIQGDKAYASLDLLPEKVDVLNFITPPNVSLIISQKAFDLGYMTYWYQPGSFDESVLAFHKDKDTTLIINQCLLIESSKTTDN